MNQILECVPNFSEGRRPEVLERIVASIADTGVSVLRHELDTDHHRAVVTFAGAPETVEEAAFAAARTAVECIDLREHAGVHPRMGALDVLPFIPVAELTMEDAVESARRVGRRLGEELGVPVILYEEAATHPGHRNLAAVRRGGLAGVRERLENDPDWRPDFGPARMHPSAGATAVGARFFLVAYNVNLHCTDLGLARRIARTIRERDGGLPCVKALGFFLEDRGLVQVSMNLTDFRVTPVRAVYDAIERLAAEAGVEVLESELIGLAPRAALPDDTVAHIRIVGFDPDVHILENVLERRA